MTPNEAVQRRRTEVKSWAVNSQSFFFNRHLVLNMGYREDFIKSWLNRQAPKSEFDQRPNVDLSVFRAEDGDLSEVKKSPDGSGVFGYGAVLHWPKSIIKIPESMDISFHYNFSENFIPDTSRQTINADRKLIRLAAPVGSSLDYGVTFQLFDRRLIVRLNWYENKLDGADGSVGNIFNQNLTQMFNFYGNNFRRIVQLDSPTGVLDPTLPNNGIDGEISNWTFVDQYAADEDGNIPDDIPIEELRAQIIADNFPNFDESVAAVNELYDILQSGYWQIKESRNRVRQFADGSIDQEDVGSLTDEEDIKSTGFEASITWNPTRSWRMAINVARQETVRSNITPNLERFIEGDWLPFIAKWGHLDWDNALATNNGNDLSTQVNENLTEYFTVMSLEGFPTDEVREWRVNLVTNYSFRDGPLNGFSVGGSMRWQSDAVIGYPLIEKEGSPMLVGDVLNGWRGEEDLSFDFQCGYSKRIKKVNWQIQLNLRNLQNIDSDEVEILLARPDGSPAKARWKPPFQWQITNTFRW